MNGYYGYGPHVGAAPAQTMSDKDAYQYLVTAMRNLAAAGVSNEKIISLFVFLGVNEAAEGLRWNRQKIQELLSQAIAMSAAR